MTIPLADSAIVFAQLDQDWAITCRRNRRAGTLGRWARQEPALADLTHLDQIAPEGKPIPRVHFAAVLRLTRAGDTTAARTLLQMVRPGLVRITRELGSPQQPSVGAEVITAGWACIDRVQYGIVTIHTASCLLRSIRRDVLRARLTHPDRHVSPHLGPADLAVDSRARTPAGPTAKPAEAVALDGPLARTVLDTAVAQGAVTKTAADLVWLTSVHQQPVAAVATAIGTSASTAYAIRADAHARLRDYYTAA